MSLFFILGAPDIEMSIIEELLRQLKIPYAYAVSWAGKERSRIRPGQIPHGWSACIPEGAHVVTVEVPRGLHAPLPPAKEGWYPSGTETAIVVDHHDDHPLARAQPEGAIPASSLGQVISLLAREGVDLSPLGWEEESALGAQLDAGELRNTLESGDFQEPIDDLLVDEGEMGEEPSPPEEWGYWAVAIGPESVLRIPDDLAAIAAADHCLAAAFAGVVPGVAPETVKRVICEAAIK